MKKKVRIRREMTESERKLSVDRIIEVVDAVGGRKNLEMIVKDLTAQEVSNVKQKKYISPQVAIRIEQSLYERYGDDIRFAHFTRYYFCPDLTDIDFERVEESML